MYKIDMIKKPNLYTIQETLLHYYCFDIINTKKVIIFFNLYLFYI